jgi:3'-phosphoadenosine 5'-phosphosulfate sulfotransferase (PAPS reductase)/FAD synthetase
MSQMGAGPSSDLVTLWESEQMITALTQESGKDGAESLTKKSSQPLTERNAAQKQHLGASERSTGSLHLKTLLTQDCEKTIDNFRVQRLMGILPKSGKATMENIPKMPNRSMYSCERYQFFLDAPFEIAQQCCGVMKKSPMNKYHRETGRQPITAMMASESRLRTQKWLHQGCNAFGAKKPMSMPMAFWTEQDVLMYIWKYKIPICSVYGDVVLDYEADGQLEGQMSFRDLGGDWELFDTDSPTLKTTGCSRTGCMFCGFGCHLEKPGEGRFERMKVTHPKQYDYIMRPKEEGGLNYKEVIDWINEHGNMHIRY